MLTPFVRPLHVWMDASGADLREAYTLDPKSKEIRDAYVSITDEEAAAKVADKKLYASMAKGVRGPKQKPPEGVPADAVDISGDGGLCKRILVAGDPAEGTPFETAEVQVHYVGTLLSDGSQFDSSRSRPGNFKFQIGMGSVVKGWDEGVATMHKGEKAELFCRADYGYGEDGLPPRIPGGATLKFEVELLSWAEAVVPTKKEVHDEAVARLRGLSVDTTTTPDAIMDVTDGTLDGTGTQP